MTGILVCGDNHFIVRGPRPSRETAVALVRHWSVIQIGAVTPAPLGAWRISTKELRENLRWAIVVPGETGHSAAVVRLLSEMRSRGVPIHDAAAEVW